MDLLGSIFLMFAIGWVVAVIIVGLAAWGDSILVKRGNKPTPTGCERRKTARRIRAEARQRRENAYRERTLKRVKKAPGAHLRVTPKEADAIRKSGILDGARLDTHVYK